MSRHCRNAAGKPRRKRATGDCGFNFMAAPPASPAVQISPSLLRLRRLAHSESVPLRGEEIVEISNCGSAADLSIQILTYDSIDIVGFVSSGSLSAAGCARET